MRRASRAFAAVDPRALLAGAVVLSGALLIGWLAHLTFFGDDWDPLLLRRGLSADVLLRPHAEHILLGPTVIYKAIQSTIGMESLVPYALVSTASFLVSVVVLFVYLRRRVGAWLALAAVLPVLFLGGAWEVLLWPFEVSFTAAMAGGIGALLLVERGEPRADAFACALLVVALAFSELALCFALGVAASLLLVRAPWRRLYVVAVPVVLYLAWYAGWGHTAENHLSLHNIAHAPAYVIDGLAASITSLLGLADPSTGEIGWGRALLVALLAVALLRARRYPPIPPPFWAALTVLLAFWLLTAAGTQPGREAVASRYQYVGAVLLLLVIGCLASGVPARAPAVAIALAVAAYAAVTDASMLHGNYQRLHRLAIEARGGLAGLEVAGAAANPYLLLGPANTTITNLNSLQVGPYLSAVRSFGSPAYTEAELGDAPPEARASADRLLATAEGVSLFPVTGAGAKRAAAAARRASCATLRGGSTVTPLGPGAILLTAPTGSAEQVRLRRFAATGFPVKFTLRGTGLLPVPRDGSSRPWLLRIAGPGPTTVCRGVRG